MLEGAKSVASKYIIELPVNHLKTAPIATKAGYIAAVAYGIFQSVMAYKASAAETKKGKAWAGVKAGATYGAIVAASVAALNFLANVLSSYTKVRALTFTAIGLIAAGKYAQSKGYFNRADSAE